MPREEITETEKKSGEQESPPKSFYTLFDNSSVRLALRVMVVGAKYADYVTMADHQPSIRRLVL